MDALLSIQRKAIPNARMPNINGTHIATAKRTSTEEVDVSKPTSPDEGIVAEGPASRLAHNIGPKVRLRQHTKQQNQEGSSADEDTLEIDHETPKTFAECNDHSAALK